MEWKSLIEMSGNSFFEKFTLPQNFILIRFPHSLLILRNSIQNFSQM